MVKVVLVDDHPVVRQGIAAILNEDLDLKVVAEAGAVEDILAKLPSLDPDVVVLDIRLPGMNGLDGCRVIRRRHPRVAVMILTSYPDEEGMIDALSEGARGFVRKESEPEILRQAVLSVADGGMFVDPKLVGSLVELATTSRNPRGPFGLTRQEMRILRFLPRGMTNRDIAQELSLSEQTVKTHVRHILQKLQVRDRAQAAALVVREELM